MMILKIKMKVILMITSRMLKEVLSDRKGMKKERREGKIRKRKSKKRKRRGRIRGKKKRRKE